MATPKKQILARDTYLNLVRAHERFAAEFADLFRREELTSAQYNVLRILIGGPKAGVPCQYIKERLLARVPDVTRLVDRMVANGLVSRTRSSEDRRVVLVSVTAKGARACRALESPVMELHLRQFEGVSSRSLTSLRDGLQQLLDLP